MGFSLHVGAYLLPWRVKLLIDYNGTIIVRDILILNYTLIYEEIGGLWPKRVVLHDLEVHLFFLFCSVVAFRSQVISV